MALPHVHRIDLYNQGVDYEVIVMKIDKIGGDIHYIRTDYLDDTDRKRIIQILNKRDARMYEAWDLFSQVTLKNGVNALEYFHQLVKVLTKSGEHLSPSLYRSGSRAPTIQTHGADTLTNTAKILEEQAQQPQPRRAGRPPKASQ